MLMLLFIICALFFVFKQQTAYELRISDWSSDVCSSDLGISLLINATTGFNLSYLIVLINIPFILIGFTQVSKIFAVKTLAAIIALEIGRASYRERVCQYV